MLETTQLMSPCYLTLAGPNKNEGILFTRSRANHEHMLHLHDKAALKRASNNQGHFIGTISMFIVLTFAVQTNIDHWKNAITSAWAENDHLLHNSLERKITAEDALQNAVDWNLKWDFDQQAQKFADQAMQQVLSTYPVLNEETVYQVVMRVASNYYESRIVYNPPKHTKAPTTEQ